MKQLFSIGPFNIHFFGIMIAIGALIGLWFFVKEARRRKLNESLLIDGALYSIMAGFIGARLVYVLIYSPAHYLANPIEILFVHQGGLSIHGGILGGLLTGYLYLKKHQLPIWETLDAAAPALILAQGISRIGCDVFGAPVVSALPWAIEFQGELLHPAQAYEFLLDYLLFGYLWVRRTAATYHGQIFLHYLIGFMAIRGIVELFRINPMILGPFSVSHALSAIGIGIGIILMMILKKRLPIKPVGKIDKAEAIKIAISILVLAIVSLGIYYLVQA
ncbi:MAG: prolipoprotein diacylglyceryl transferase [Bacillota bacterium]|nr:prolipoprotein diacylglyceryl transferase [Bacillota bacterium]